MKVSTGKILLITLLLTAITVAIALYISVNQSQKVNTTFLSVSHTQNVLFNSQKLLTAISQNEMLAREFILTNDEEYLNSFNESKASIKNEFEKLRRNTIENKVQQIRLDTLEKYIHASIAVSDSIIQAKKILNEEDKSLLIPKRNYADNIFNIESIIARVQDYEQKLLSERKNESVDAVSTFRTLLFAAFALLVILMVVLVQKLRVEVTSDRETYRIMQYNTLLMDNIRDAVISTDQDLNIVSWNNVAEKSLGWKEEEVKGKPLLSLVKQDQKEAVREGVIKRLLTGGAWEGEVNIERKTGQKATVWVSSSAIWTPGGKMRGTITIARDITSRKQLEAQLKLFNAKLGKQVEERKAEVKHVVERLVSSEKKYKQLFENNPLPMLMLSYPELGIIDANDTAVMQYGFPKEQLLRKSIKDVQLPEEVLDFKDYIKDDIAGYQDAGVWKHRKADGSIIFVEIFVHGMFVDGLKTKLVLTMISPRKLKQRIPVKNILTKFGCLPDICRKCGRKREKA